MDTKIFLDIDDVLVNLTFQLIKFHGLKNPFDDQNWRGDHCWDIVKHSGISKESFWGLLPRDFWSSLPPTEEADAIISAIDDTVGLDKVCFLTTPCGTAACIEGKVDWNKKNFPDIPMICTMPRIGGPGDCIIGSKEFCAGPNSVLIDDHTRNVVNWINADGIGYLVPRPWNCLHMYEGRDTAPNEIRGLLHCLLRIEFFKVAPISPEVVAHV